MKSNDRPRRDGARPFRPNEAPLGVRPGLGGGRRAGGAVPNGPASSASPKTAARRTSGGMRARAVAAIAGLRRSATLRRLVAAVLFAAAAAVPIPLATGDALPIATLTVSGAQLIDAAQIARASGIAAGGNVLAARLHEAETAVQALPLIDTARVRAGLPGSIEISVVERAPLLRWQLRGATYLVDEAGVLVAAADSPLLAARAAPAIAALPLVRDERTDATLEVGDVLPKMLFDAVTRLAGLSAGEFGSTATMLSLRLDPTWGVLLTATGGPSDASWTAVFGTYTANLRPPALIPEQIRLLRSLLSRGEERFGWIILADGSAGTYTDRGVTPPPAGGGSAPSPTPSASTRPSGSPTPSTTP